MNQKTICLLVVCLILFESAFFSLTAFASTLMTLGDYRSIVQKSYDEYRGRELALQGNKEMNENLSSVADTQFFSQVYFSDDRRPTLNPAFQGLNTKSFGASLGLQKQFMSGLSVELSQYLSHTIIEGASSSAVSVPQFFDTYPKLSLRLPLWRNLSGSETKLKEEVKHQESKTEILKADLKFSELDIKIDSTFYTLAATRENLELQKEILDRAHLISKWVQSKYQRNLSDRSDLYQAESVVVARRLQFEEQSNRVVEAEREFNFLRGVINDQVSEVLQVDELAIETLKMAQTKMKKRKDLILNHYITQIQTLSQSIQGELTQPNLDFIAEGQWNGRDREWEEAQKEVFSKNQTLWYLGLKFSMPLDPRKSQGTRASILKLRESNQFSEQTQIKEYEKVWSNFVSLGQNLYEQIYLVRQLEKVQKQKADEERRRFNSGRSTTFQLLTFEQDYAQSKSQRINLELKARNYLSQVHLFQ